MPCVWYQVSLDRAKSKGNKNQIRVGSPMDWMGLIMGENSRREANLERGVLSFERNIEITSYGCLVGGSSRVLEQWQKRPFYP